MRVEPAPTSRQRTPDQLEALFRGVAEGRLPGERPLVSIALEIEPLDPLAVLELIYDESEAHFYAENPREGWAVAGADAVLSWEGTGESRFASARDKARAVFDRGLLVRDSDGLFAGPVAFTSFGFDPHGIENAPFPPAGLFVPRWQVGRAGGKGWAVANVAIEDDFDAKSAASRIWAAHAKFQSFEFLDSNAGNLQGDAVAGAVEVSEPGDPGWYSVAVRDALAGIERGEIRKVVLARRLDLVRDGGWHPLRVLNGLRERFPGCTAFSLANGRGQSFIGATPERLVSLRDGMYFSEALAGSVGRGDTAAEDAALIRNLVQSDKDLREHRMVLDSIGRRLGRLGVRLEPEGPIGVLTLSNVHHLRAPLRGPAPDGVHLLDAVEALHPTPAVGGTPRLAAGDWIRRLEPFDRGLYAGALGWVDPRGDGEFFVGIRSALVDGAKISLYAGAGVVAGSDPEREWAETEWKLQALLKGLGHRVGLAWDRK